MNPSDKTIIQEALRVLMEYLEPLKVARLVAACKLG